MDCGFNNASECMEFVLALKDNVVIKKINTLSFVLFKYLFGKQIHTHTHTHVYISINI